MNDGSLPPALPTDAVLLPLSEGKLLVSPSHATFCRVPSKHVPLLRGLLAGDPRNAPLPDSLVEQLRLHGWFEPPRPTVPATPNIHLQLTNACNLDCVYCCTDSGMPRRTELTFEQWLAVADEAHDCLGPGARFALLGGEPLLQPFALDVAQHLRERQVQLTLFTNGVLLSEPSLASRVAALVRTGMQVRVSLAGVTRETCDQLSGAPRFDAALAGVQAVADHGAEVVVDIMLVPTAVEEIANQVGQLRRRLPPRTKLSFGLLFQGGRESGDHLFESRLELEAALDRIAFEAGEVIPGEIRSPLAKRREACTCALGHHLNVRSDGRLFSCFRMEEQVGDLQQERFRAALERLRARPRPARVLPFCRDCALVTLCGGACRSENLLLTGDPERPLCGPWRIRVLSELLAEDRVAALEWPSPQLASEARRRGFDAPDHVVPVRLSTNVADSGVGDAPGSHGAVSTADHRLRLPVPPEVIRSDGCRRR